MSDRQTAGACPLPNLELLALECIDHNEKLSQDPWNEH